MRSASAEGLGSAARDPMLATVERTPEQWRRAREIALRATLPTERPRAVVIVGVGGSGVAGDVASLLASLQADVPVLAVHGERLPAFVGSDDLVVLVSHSGGTAETLTCARQAADRGATRVAVTSGGSLADDVAPDGTVIVVPDEAPPRASMALLTVPVLAALERAGVVAGLLDDCGAVPDRLTARMDGWDRAPGTDPGPAGLASRLGQRTPHFLGAGPLEGLVAVRARNQVAENAERPAHASALPEAGHNELVGWAGAGTDGAGDLVVLRSTAEPRLTARRVAETVALAGPGFAGVHEHRLASGAPLERIAEGFLFVDLLSVHLALLAGVDPTPITVIDELKRRL